MRSRGAAVCLAVALSLCVAPHGARAQDGPSSADEQAAALKREGDARMHEMHYREALEAYDQAYRVSPTPAILYNRARALQLLGEYPDALDALEEFERVAPAELKARVPDLEGLLEEVRSGVSTLVVHANVDGAQVIVRRKLEGATPLPALRLRVGSASVEVTAPHYRAFSREVELPSGGVTTIEATLEKEEQPAAKEVVPPLAPRESIAPPTPPRTTVKIAEVEASPLKPVGYVTASLAVANIATGAVFGALAMAKKSDVDAHCPQDACDPSGRTALNEGRTFATAATVTVITGAVLVAASAILFFVASRRAVHNAASDVRLPLEATF